MMCPEPDREMIPLSLFFYRSTEASEMICPELVIQDFDSMTTPAQRAAVVKIRNIADIINTSRLQAPISLLSADLE